MADRCRISSSGDVIPRCTGDRRHLHLRLRLRLRLRHDGQPFLTVKCISTRNATTPATTPTTPVTSGIQGTRRRRRRRRKWNEWQDVTASLNHYDIINGHGRISNCCRRSFSFAPVNQSRTAELNALEINRRWNQLYIDNWWFRW